MHQWTMECGDRCSSSAATEVIDDDIDHILVHSEATLAEVARRAAGTRKRHSRDNVFDCFRFIKRSAEPCDGCGELTVAIRQRPTDTEPTCEMCQLASWASDVCSACGDMQVMPQSLKRCPDQFFCDACDTVK